MLSRLRKWLIGEDPDEEIQEPNMQKGVRVHTTPEGKLFLTIASNTCPNCGSHKGFTEGPSGGMSTNIFCADCGQGFNITPMIGIAERI